jgi:hypothetical protein
MSPETEKLYCIGNIKNYVRIKVNGKLIRASRKTSCGKNLTAEIGTHKAINKLLRRQVPCYLPDYFRNENTILFA